MRPPLLLLLLLPLSAACSSTSASPSAAPLALQSYCTSVARSICDRFAPCCRAGGMSVDVDACLSRQKSRCDEAVAVEQSKGRVYDASSAGACVAGADAFFDGCVRRDLAYWRTQAVSEACARVWTGSAKAGEACTDDADCASAPDERVACVSDGSKRVCAAIHLAASGQSCDLTPGGAMVGCADGLYCASGTCRAPSAENGGCSPSLGSCKDGLACHVKALVCKSPGKRGDSCSNGVPCGAGLYCGLAGTCTAFVGAGGSCRNYERCADGLACVSEQCTALQPDGASCNWSGACASGRCDISGSSSTGTCVSSGGSIPHWPVGFDPGVCNAFVTPKS